MGHLERQGHVLYPRDGAGEPVPCHRLTLMNQIKEHQGYEHPDIPGVFMDVDDPTHPYHHDDRCRVCKGTGTYRPRVIVDYQCLGCDRVESRPEDFDDTCCLDLAPHLIEFRAEHEDGEHRWHRRPGCPVCIEERMLAQSSPDAYGRDRLVPSQTPHGERVATPGSPLPGVVQ